VQPVTGSFGYKLDLSGKREYKESLLFAREKTDTVGRETNN
jgi:hypothetical protein